MKEFDLDRPPQRKVPEEERELLKHVQRRRAALEKIRRAYEPTYRSLARHFSVNKGRFRGEKPDENTASDKPLFDGTGLSAARTLASGMQSGLTSQTSPWFRLAFQNTELAEIDSGKTWLQIVQDRMENVFNRSNFYGQTGTTYNELGIFGTNVMFIEDDAETVIRCRAFTIGEFWLDGDHAGRINTLMYKQEMSAMEIVDTWPDTAPSYIYSAARSETPTTFTVFCLIEPRKRFNRFSKRKDQRPWSCIFWIDGNDNGLLEVSGFYEFPAVCPRWEVTSSDVYGQSPGMIALADSRLLQEMTEDSLVALRREVRPPLGMPSNLRLLSGTHPDLSQDAINIYSGYDPVDASPIIPLIQVKANLQETAAFMENYRSQLRSAFYVDMFLMLDMQQRDLTATEVRARNAEKMVILGPVLDRLRSELFQALIDRTFNIMYRNGIIPTPPEEIAGAQLKIEFVSALALSQQEAKLIPMDNWIAKAISISEVFPEVLDLINIDEYIRMSADKGMVDPALVRSTAEVEEIRQQRLEQQQQAMQQQQQVTNLAMTESLASSENMLADAAVKEQGIMQ